MSGLPVDDSLLELFRIELETHSRVLETGLLGVEADPAPAKVEPLMRAAHSIKGAARIIGLSEAVELAHVMEDVLSAAQKQAIRLSAPQIDELLRATDFYKKLAAQPVASIAAALQNGKAQLEELTSAVKSIPLTGGAEPPEPLPGKAQEKPPPPPAAAFPEQARAGGHPAEGWGRPPATSRPEPAPAGGGFVDESMLDLFRIELETHSRVLEAGLLGVEADPAPAKVEPLMRAAHSIKGAARIVGLSEAVELAHVMEDVLTAAQKQAIRLSAPQIDELLRANDFYKKLATLPVSSIAAALRGGKAQLEELTSAVKAIPLTGGAAPQPSTLGKAPEKTAPEPAREAAAVEPAESRDPGFVRVQSENLSNLMGLSGECLVHARSARPLSEGLRKIKALQNQLEDWVAFRMGSRFTSRDRAGVDPVTEVAQEFSLLQELMHAYIQESDAYFRYLEKLNEKLYSQVIRCRMRPFSEGLVGFERMIRDLCRALKKKIAFRVEGASTPVDRDIMEKLEAPLTHLLRNAADHGIEAPDVRLAKGKPEEGTIRLEAVHRAGLLEVTLTDDGKGIDPESIRRKVVEKGYATESMASGMSRAELLEFLFLPGFSTASNVTEYSGRGVGLDVVHAMVHSVRGMVRVESAPEEGTTFRLMLPLALSVMRALMVDIGGESYAVPLVRVDRLLRVEHDSLRAVEGRLYYEDNGEALGLVDARQVLQMPIPENKVEKVLPVIVLSDRLCRYGIVVGGFLGERELVVLPLDSRLGKVTNISAGAVMEDGSPLLILDVDDVVRTMDNLIGQGRVLRAVSQASKGEGATRRVLVVDDSLTVREVERKLLENRGYEVAVAVDGMDGLNALQERRYDLVITDVDMPRMDGIELVRRIRQDADRKGTPVMIVSYKDREEDKLRGLQAGADYYLTKSSFHDDRLIEAVRDLIGEA